MTSTIATDPVAAQRQADRDAAGARREAERLRDLYYAEKRRRLAESRRLDEEHAYRQMTPEQRRRVRALLASHRGTASMLRRRPTAGPDCDAAPQTQQRPRLSSPIGRSLTPAQVAGLAQGRATGLDPGARAVLAALLGAMPGVR